MNVYICQPIFRYHFLTHTKSSTCSAFGTHQEVTLVGGYHLCHRLSLRGCLLVNVYGICVFPEQYPFVCIGRGKVCSPDRGSVDDPWRASHAGTWRVINQKLSIRMPFESDFDQSGSPVGKASCRIKVTKIFNKFPSYIHKYL